MTQKKKIKKVKPVDPLTVLKKILAQNGKAISKLAYT